MGWLKFNFPCSLRFSFAKLCGWRSCSCANQKTLTAKYAKKGRKVREEIQIETLLAVLESRRCELGVIVRRVDIQNDRRIVDRKVHDVLLVHMLNVAGIGSRRGLQESFDQFTAGDIGMAMLAGKFRNHGPSVISGGLESFPKNLNGGWVRWRPVDQRDHRGVTPAIEHLVQADLQRTELAAVRVEIDDHRGAFRVGNRRDCGFVFARNY